MADKVQWYLFHSLCTYSDIPVVHNHSPGIEYLSTIPGVYRICVVSSFWLLLDLRKSLAVLKSGSQQLGLQKSFNSVANAEILFSAKSASCLIDLKFHHSRLPSHNSLT